MDATPYPPWPARPRRSSPEECGLRGNVVMTSDGRRVQIVLGDLRPARVWTRHYPDLVRRRSECAA